MPHLSAGLGEGKRVELRDKLPLSSLYIICVIGGALAAVAHHAPELTGTELRVLLHLCATAAANSLSVPASSRDLEVATRTARSAIVTALDGLAKRGLIATRQGTPRSPATHLLRLLEVATISGPISGPPPASSKRFPQGAVLIQDRSGPEIGPPPTAIQQLASAGEIVDPEGVLSWRVL